MYYVYIFISTWIAVTGSELNLSSSKPLHCVALDITSQGHDIIQLHAMMPNNHTVIGSLQYMCGSS